MMRMGIPLAAVALSAAAASADESVGDRWEVVDVAGGTKPALGFASDGTAYVMGMTEMPGGEVWVAEGSGLPGDGWTVTMVGGGYLYGPGDLIVDPGGQVHLAWHNHDAQAPQHVRFEPADGRLTSFIIPTPRHDGWDDSLAIGPGGDLHLASIDPSGFFGVIDSLQYGVFDGASWQFESAVPGSGVTMYGLNTSIAIAGDGTVHILFCRADDWADPGDLVHAVSTPAGGWESSTVVTGGPVGRFPSLAIAGDDTLHAAWLDIDPADDSIGHVVSATLAPGSGSWETQTVDTLTAVSLGFSGARTSVSVDLGPDGSTHLAFADTTVVRYAKRRPAGGAWKTVDVVRDSEGAPYRGLAVVRARPDNTPSIAFWQGNAETAMVRLATQTGLATQDPPFAATITYDPDTSELELSWPSSTGLQYQPESTSDATSWTSFGPPSPGTGSTITVPLGPPVSPPETHLFRVTESP